MILLSFKYFMEKSNAYNPTLNPTYTHIARRIAKQGWRLEAGTFEMDGIGELFAVCAYREDEHRYVVYAESLIEAFLQLEEDLSEVPPLPFS